MRNLTLSTLAVIIVATVVAYFFRDTEWECRIRYVPPQLVAQTERSISLRGGSVVTEGTLLTSSGVRIGDGRSPGTILATDIHGLGDYRFTYSGRVESLRIAVNGREVYHGPPIKAFRAGPGEIGFELGGERPLSLVATDRCSLGSLVGSFSGG